MKLVFTIGHSTRSLEQFVGVLKAHGVQRVVDVRHYPQSKHNPQFDRNELEHALPAQGIEYVWLGELLGGFRKGGYEKYAKTDGYKKGIRELLAIAENVPTAVMCAERVFWRCHRRYIANSLVKKKFKVVHILDAEAVYEHKKSADLEEKMKTKLPCDRQREEAKLENSRKTFRAQSAGTTAC